MKQYWLASAVLLALSACAWAQDTDGDGIPDAVETELGTNPAAAERLEQVYDDRARGEGDDSVGAELEVAHDLTTVSFGPVASGRWLWRLDFTEPWVVRGDVALIIYVDCDNDPDTGRTGGGVQGTDLMIRPTTVQAFGVAGAVRSASAGHGNALYLIFDAPIKVEDGQAALRAYVLVQNRENPGDQDRTPWFEVRAPVSEAAPMPLERGHPMYRPPEEIQRIRARVPVDEGGRQAVITWITSWPTECTLQFGETARYTGSVPTQGVGQNHRVVLDGLQPDSTYHFRIRARGSLAELRSSDDQTFTTAVREPAASVARQSVPLSVSGAPGSRQPVSSGLPFPQGALGSAEGVRVLDAGGREVPCQVEVVTRWPDNTVKWILLDFQADVPASGEAQYQLEFGREVTRAAAEQAIAIEQADEAITVDTGVLKVRLDPEHFALLGEAWLDANGDGTYADQERVTDSEGAGILLTSLAGEHFTSLGAPEVLTVARRGPLHSVIVAQGHHLSEAGEPLFTYEVRLHFYAGLPLVRVFHSFENDVVDETFTTVRSLDLRLLLAGGSEGGFVLLPDGSAAALGAGTRARLLQSYDDRCRLEGAEADIEGQQRALGSMDVQGRNGGLTVAVRNFWQLYPKAIGADEQGAVIGIMPELPEDEYASIDRELEDKLYYYLLGGVYKLHSGVGKTHEILVEFHPGLADAARARDLAARCNTPPLAAATPQWYCDSKAFRDLTPRTEGEFNEYEAMVDRVLGRMVGDRESGREYGMLNFGDYWGERGYNWGNIEYDTQHGLFMQFARTARREFFDNAMWAARHNVDVDIIHHARDPQDVGKAICHCLCHTGDYYPDGYRPGAIHRGGCNIGHMWTRGNLEYALLTGDLRAMRVALQTAQYMAGPLMVNYRMSKGAERATAWPLFAVMAAYEATGDEYYLNAAHLIARDTVAEQDRELGHWHIPAGYSQVKPTPIGGYAWCAGLLLTSLEFANTYLSDAEIDDTIVRGAEWLARDEWIAERKGFRSASCDTLSASVRPGYECYRTPAAMLRAYELTGDRKFLDIARIGFSYAVAAGGGSGKGGSVQLTLSPHAVYKLKQAGITSLDTSQWEQAARLFAPGWVAVEPGAGVSLNAIVLNNSDDELTATVRLDQLPEGWQAPEPVTARLAAGASRTVSLELPAAPLKAGDAAELKLVCQAAEERCEAMVVLDCPPPAELGDAVGLIAGEGDFLGAALAAAGVEYAEVQSLEDLQPFGVIYLGTQAHTLDAAGLQQDSAKLLRWVHQGGRLIISQMNDDAWSPGFLPGLVVLDEENSENGETAAPDHPIFNIPNKVRRLAGMAMYDTIARADGWQALLKDAAGRPAMIETKCGAGKILAFMPSVERYYTGELTVADQPQMDQYRRFFENLVAHAGP